MRKSEGGHEMGRVSKRKTSIYISTKKIVRYNAGIYARISSDHDIVKNESIETQIEIAKEFVEKTNSKGSETIEIVDYYRDLGKTGSNFNRDEFKRLLQDVRLGDINCVIVKDLSRFGRNYLEAGNYIEKIFPFLGVRFIAIADGYDTGEKGNDTKQMSSEIKNLVNDMYAKDFSVKARTGLHQRRQEGSYVGGPPPYGYMAVREGSIRKLVPDENTVEIVRWIFTVFVEKKSYSLVTDELNKSRINPPTIYKETGEVYCPLGAEYKGWDNRSLKRILKRKSYIGTLVQGKTSIIARDEKNRVHKPETEWVVKENIHDALIDDALYQQVQEVIMKIEQNIKGQDHPSKGYPIKENIFDNVLYCGVCGKKMTRTSYVEAYANGHKERVDSYLCSNSSRTKTETCKEPNRITKRRLVETLIPLLQSEFGIYMDKPRHYTEIMKEQIRIRCIALEKQHRETEQEIYRLEEERERAYKKYHEGVITQKEYVAYKLEQPERQIRLQKQLEECETNYNYVEKSEEKILKAVSSIVKLKRGQELTMKMVDSLIEKIYLYPGKRIEILFKCTIEWLKEVGINA